MTSYRSSNWKVAVKAFFHPRVITMLFFGFSAGLPLYLIFSSLSLWLKEAGVARSAVTFFSWATLMYSFKFVWAPLVDQMPIPILTRLLGRRRGWILTAQIAIAVSIAWMAMIDPADSHTHLTLMAMACVALAFSSATQDICIDAYRIESTGNELQAMMASTYIAGYRIGMLVAGAGALFMAEFLGSSKASYNYSAWQTTYWIMAGCMVVGMVTTLVIPEPEGNKEHLNNKDFKGHIRSFILFLMAASSFVVWFYLTSGLSASLKETLIQWKINGPLAGFLIETLRLACGICAAVLTARIMVGLGIADKRMVKVAYVEPVSDFFNRYGLALAWLLLSLIGLYRISDIVLGVIANVFYQDLGFTKTQIASVVKTFGLFMTIAGGFLGGILSIRFGVMRVLFAGALLAALTNLLFVVMANTGPSLPMLYLVISADNLAGGIASAAFVAFLSSLTSVRFTATQYALFSSLMTLIPKLFAGYSGSMVDNMGYPFFFTLTAVIGIPVLVLVWLSSKFLYNHDKNQSLEKP